MEGILLEGPVGLRQLRLLSSGLHIRKGIVETSQPRLLNSGVLQIQAETA